MKKAFPYLIAAFLFGWLLTGDIINDRKISKLKQELEEVKDNTELSVSGLTKVSAILILRAEWDKSVAEKIRELDEEVKGLYGPRTNQIISRPIHSL